MGYKDEIRMQRALALLFVTGVSAFMAPVPLSGRMMLRAASSAKGLPAASMHRTVHISALKMQEGEPPVVEGEVPVVEDFKFLKAKALRLQAEETAAIEAKQDEQRYIQQSSGVNYRKNDQDSLLFGMGGAIILIPFVAVAIAIGTGYIPLDYVR